MKRFIFSVVAVFATIAMAFAQMQMPSVPLDPAVRKGVLPNGLTYYIQHNEWPEKRVDFYIAQKVGSMQEEDNQRGLAHFLEHMCFNGTTHFPGDGLKQYLETIGVKFGENLNAYTSLDETVYNINNVNVETEGAIDKCLLILHDWSHDLLLEGKEIDKERGVINEEWRMRSSAMMRMYEKALPEIYGESKYGYRLPIGTMDVVMNFPHQAIRDYYKKWYRPDLQAIIVVGDIDVDDIENRIKTVFEDIKAVENPAVREYYPVFDNKEPIFVCAKDKEQQRNTIDFSWKTPAVPMEMKSTLNYIAMDYVIGAMSSMFNDRINEIIQKENPPFLGAGFSYENFLVAKTMDAFSGSATYKDNGQEAAVKALYREILRAKRHGFTISEYERFKSEYLSQLEAQYMKRDKITNTTYVDGYVQNFLYNEPSPSIEWTYQMMNQIVPSIPIEEVNGFISQMPDANLVITVFCPDKEDINYPTKEEILGYMAEVEAENIEAYKEEVNNDPLVENLGKPAKVKSIKDEKFGFKVITLSNGIKVHVKKTDFSPNNISMQAVSWGGTSYYSNDEYMQSGNADMVGIGGWGNFSSIDLGKKLSGIQASVSPYIDSRTEGLNGSCVKKDFETMLQLTYLAFTAPRKDTEVFNSTIQRQKQAIANQELNPMTALSDTIASVIYNNNVRATRTKVADLDKMNYDRIIEIYKERFADANDFEFYLVGDLDADSVAPLLAQYLGALPVLKSSEKIKDIDLRIKKGEVKNVFEKEMETPNSVTLFMYTAPIEMTMKNNLMVSMLEQSMDMLYTETVREDEGGAYGVPVNGAIQDYPEKVVSMQIQLPTSPDKRERMAQVVYAGVEQICNEGPKQEYLDKIKEYMHRSHAESLKKNGYWMNQIMNWTRFGRNYVDGYDETVDSITVADLKELATKIFRSGNRIEVGITSPVK